MIKVLNKFGIIIIIIIIIVIIIIMCLQFIGALYDFLLCYLSTFSYQNSRRSFGSRRVSADFVDIVRSPCDVRTVKQKNARRSCGSR